MAVRYVEIGQYPDVRREVRGKLSEILVATANPGTYAAPEDVTGTFLEMGLDGLWTGPSVGSFGSIDELNTLPTAYLATGSTAMAAGVSKTFMGAGWVDSSPNRGNAAKLLVSKIKAGLFDANIVICSDSTAAGNTRWPYFVAQKIASLYPTHSVLFAAFNSSTLTYDASVSISTGSGARIITIYNASISGASPDYFRGASVNSGAFRSINSVDLFVLAHGLNLNSLEPTEERSSIFDFLLDVADMYSEAGIAGVIECPVNPTNPSYDFYKQKVFEVGACFREIGAQVVDLFSAMAGNVSSSDYLDSIHPNDAIQSAIMAPFIFSELFYASGLTVTAGGLALSRKRNLLANGDFTSWTGGTPDGGWSVANGVMSKDTVTFETKAASLKVVTTPGECQLYLPVPAATFSALKGKYVTLIFRVFIPDSQGFPNSPAARPQLTTNNYVQFGGSTYLATGRWIWIRAFRRIISTDTSIVIRFYVSTSPTSTAAGQVVYIDRAGLYAGLIPGDPAA